MLSTEDRLEITQILALHAHLFDGNELHRLDELFTSDAVYDLSSAGVGTFEGINVIRAAAAQMSEAGLAPLAHFVTNIVITSTGEDSATARSKGLMIMADGAIQGVTHDDELRRHGGSWRLSRRVIGPAIPAALDHH